MIIVFDVITPNKIRNKTRNQIQKFNYLLDEEK